ncbi:MAG TPA: hypothetical protein P5307_20810, partial [Pirellulaceae bacterium]|nr:hypothetical protein [Pirellulaceae bacterium]
MLERAAPRTKLHGNITPKKWNYISTGAGHYGLQYNYVVLKHVGSIEFYIALSHFPHISPALWRDFH